jgi:hypothetical protein
MTVEELVGPAQEQEPTAERAPPLRVAVAVALPTLAAATMAGGVFNGAGGRAYASVAGLSGVALAAGVRRIRRPLAANAVFVAGLFATGVLVASASGFDAVTHLRDLVVSAADSRAVLRPPVDLTPGWQAIIGWLMATVGFVAAWVALAFERPALALLVPMPIAAIAGISVPRSDQVASGIVMIVLFAAGLGVLSGRRDEDARRPLGYEIRRALRAVPLVGAMSVALVLLAKANVLFPHPVIDPTLEPQKPKTIPLSEVEDRVLFEVSSSISGPWRIGALDEYDGADWRLPPFAESKLRHVPRSGVVEPAFRPGVKATFTVAGLGGTVLPGLPNTVGMVAEGDYQYDARSGSIRLTQGQVQAGLKYSVVAAALPAVEDLRAVKAQARGDVTRFADIVAPPPAVKALLARAPKTSKWDEFDFLRSTILAEVTATGQGIPRSVTPSRVADMIAGSKEGSPFEIVAAQAMLARWAGLPSRIGYGFDGGELVDGKLQVRPRNGANWVEVFFPDHGWLPVIGSPRKAKATVGDPADQQYDPNVLPSEDIAVQLFLPVITPGRSLFGERLRTGVLAGAGILLLALICYLVFPVLHKAVVRSRRRAAALQAGPRARIELAYTEWRDALTDFGYRYPTDPPLGFLRRLPPDEEHTELAWLVTRTLWGDLRSAVTDEHAASAEELSRALRRRLAQAHPATLRVVARFSRLSRRHPFHPGIDRLRGREARRAA